MEKEQSIYAAYEEIKQREIKELRNALEQFGGEAHFGPDYTGEGATGVDAPYILCNLRSIGPCDVKVVGAYICKLGNLTISGHPMFASGGATSEEEMQEINLNDIAYGNIEFITGSVLEALNARKELIPAPIDNKNLMEDAFEDDVFEDFYAAPDHRRDRNRHLVGTKGEAYVDVSWEYGSHAIQIKVIAVNPIEDFKETSKNVLDDYKKEFSSWQCEGNPGLVVKFNESEYSSINCLVVEFFFQTES